jgi:RND family efflux transporter MFP subunit
VATAPAEIVDLPSSFEAGGVVRARTNAAIASRLLAPVAAVHVRAGDRVRRGAPLVTLEGREIAAIRSQARAAASASEEGVRAAEGSVRAAEAALALARATHERVRALHEKRSATPHELDQATAALDGARAQLDSVRASLAAAVASRSAAGAADEAAAAAQAYTTLTAPFDGVITERLIDPGDMAAPGARLLTLEDPRALRLEVMLDEARAAVVSKDQAVRVSQGGTEPRVWVEAVVGEIARVDPASHSFLVKIDLPATVTAPSGAFGRARFEGPTRKAIVIPAASAVRRGQLTFVYVVGDDHRVRLQPISPGAQTGDRLEVLAGLDERARVVRQPPAAIADGARINEASR